MSIRTDQAISIICELVLRERIRFKRGDLAQAHIELGGALHDLVADRSSHCTRCEDNRTRIEALEACLVIIEEELDSQELGHRQRIRDEIARARGLAPIPGARR